MKRTLAILLVVLLAMTAVFAQAIYETNAAGEKVLLFDARQIEIIEVNSIEPAGPPEVQEASAETVIGTASAEITVVVTEEQALESQIAAEEEAAGGADSYVLEGSALEAFAA